MSLLENWNNMYTNGLETFAQPVLNHIWEGLIRIMLQIAACWVKSYILVWLTLRMECKYEDYLLKHNGVYHLALGLCENKYYNSGFQKQDVEISSSSVAPREMSQWYIFTHHLSLVCRSPHVSLHRQSCRYGGLWSLMCVRLKVYSEVLCCMQQVHSSCGNSACLCSLLPRVSWSHSRNCTAQKSGSSFDKLEVNDIFRN